MEVFMSQSQLYKSYCQYSADVHEASFLRPNNAIRLRLRASANERVL